MELSKCDSTLNRSTVEAVGFGNVWSLLGNGKSYPSQYIMSTDYMIFLYDLIIDPETVKDRQIVFLHRGRGVYVELDYIDGAPNTTP
jgi:hypothetical protein